MFKLDVKSREPMYEQLEKLITKYVSLGVLAPDDKLPSVRAMAQELGINPNTVAKTYKILEARGIIYTIAGKGVFIANNDSAVKKLKDDAIKSFSSAVKSAKDAGFSDSELSKVINSIYKGGNADD